MQLLLRMDATASPDLEDYSASSTLITFDNPLPLIRGPIRAGPADDPDGGPHVLAFRSPKAWASVYAACHASVVRQCEGGAQIGCAISASSKCKPPWWRSLFGARVDLKEREICEEREMEACLAAAKTSCVAFATDKCLNPFRDARIAVGERRVTPKLAAKLISLASMPDCGLGSNSIGLNLLCFRVLGDRELGATNYRASDLLGPDNNIEKFLD